MPSRYSHAAIESSLVISYMREAEKKSYLQRARVGVIFFFALVCIILLSKGKESYPDLHIMLDTSMFLLSGVLSMLFWEVGSRTGQSFPKWLSMSFTITSFWEFLHVIIHIEWTGPSAKITHIEHLLRPAVWPPSAYILPIGIGCSIWLLLRSKQYTSRFWILLLLLSTGLCVLALEIPRYTNPTWFGFTRPTLILVPLLWLVLLFLCWVFRRSDRMLPPLVFTAAVLVPAQLAIAYSRTPHDSYAMVAHFGRIAGYLTLLLAIMQMGSSDMLARLQAERKLAQLNEELEHRVADRTMQLEAEVAARKQVEQEQLKSQRLLQAIVDNSTAVIYAKDLQGHYILANRRFIELFHLTKDTVLGRTDHEIFPQEVADAFRAVDERVVLSPVAITEEEVAPHDDGLHTYISVKCPLWNQESKPYGIFGISTDITARKKIEESLRASEERTRLIVETALDAVVTIDGKGVISGWNPQAELIFGWTAQEAIGLSLTDTIIPQQDRPAHRNGLERYLSTGDFRISNRRIELMALHRDGHEFPVELSITPIRTDDAVTFSAFVRDITERKLAEAKVQAQLERLKLLHHITRAIGGREDLGSIYQVMLRSLEDNLSFDFGCVCDYDSINQQLAVKHIGLGSQQIAEQLALTEQAYIPVDGNGLSLCVKGKLVYEPDVSQVNMPFPQRLTRVGLGSLVVAPLLVENTVFGVFIVARKSKNNFSSGECEFLRQLTEHVALAAHQTQLYDALQKAYEDLRLTQQAVMQQERLRALGQMASGIAHDINNAISPAALYTESLLETEPNLSSQARKHLETIQRSLDDVAETVARMREFYRQREPQLALVPVNINTLMQQVIDLTRARWNDMPQKKGILIQIHTELEADLPLVMGIESEIREALINLIFNAVDAMPSGGTLTLRTQLIEQPTLTAEITAAQNIQIEIADTGIGMDEETRTHCAEPFFTTKGERGTGLGLAMVYGVIRRHRAEMEIESAVGQGTVIRLIFPVQKIVAAKSSEVTAPVILSRLQVLVVDDDPLLLKSLRDALESDGHFVTTASGGKEGIETFLTAQREGRPFTVVFTDLGMPYVDGRKVASAIKEASPSTPVILLTGWGQRLSAEGDVPPHVDHVLSKPPKLRTMREALALCVPKHT